MSMPIIMLFVVMAICFIIRMFHTDGKVLKPYGMMGQSYICEYEEQ